nr:hypothetical protein [Tanacetum cinerariifolium]
NERTAGVRTDDSTMTNQRTEPSLETDEDFDTPMMGSDTQLVVFESADKLYEEFERNKRIIDLEIPSFSLGLTQEDEMKTGLYAAEYEMGPETHEEVIKTAEKCEQEFYVGKGVKNSSIIRSSTNMEELKVEKYMANVENAHSTYGGRTKLDKVDIDVNDVFLSVVKKDGSVWCLN